MPTVGPVNDETPLRVRMWKRRVGYSFTIERLDRENRAGSGRLLIPSTYGEWPQDWALTRRGAIRAIVAYVESILDADTSEVLRVEYKAGGMGDYLERKHLL